MHNNGRESAVEWKTQRFDAITNIANGMVNPTEEPHIDAMHIGPENIESGTGRIKNTASARELGLTSGKYAFDECAIVYAKIRPNLNKVCIPPFSGICSADAYPIWPNDDLVTKEYLFYFMISPMFLHQAVRVSMRTGMPKINRNDLGAIKVAIPPLPEQQKIAAILSTWDRAIELTEKLIAAKQKRKQALMQQLLTGKVRLPEFQGGKINKPADVVRVPAAVRRGIYPPSVQAGIPKITDRPHGWRETTMDALLQIKKRPIQLVDDTEYQLVVAKRNRGGIEPRERLLGREVKTPTQFEVRSGDFVISKRQIIHGACGVVPTSLDGAVVSNEYSVCKVNETLDMEFLKYLSHTLYFQQTCFHASVGVAIEKMIFRLEEWLRFPFLIPSIEEQRGIVSVLSAMDRELNVLANRVRGYGQQKKGLMQQLLTGKVQVKVDAETEQV